MRRPRLKMVILGLSITSSWGNGHATTYRALVRELVRRGHTVLFLERDVPGYAENRDAADGFGRTELYASVADLRRRFEREVRDADFVMVGSYVPQGVAVGRWVLAQHTYDHRVALLEETLGAATAKRRPLSEMQPA